MSEPAHGERFPPLGPTELSDEQRAVYDAVAGPPRADGPIRVVDAEGHLTGPFNALLYTPAVGQAVQQLGTTLRFGGSLPARTRELVICAVAAHLGSDYEWYAHSRVALSVGVSAAELECVRSGVPPRTLTDEERAALRLAVGLVRDRVVDDEAYADARTHHGYADIAELAVLVGYYQTLAGVLATAGVLAPLDP